MELPVATDPAAGSRRERERAARRRAILDAAIAVFAEKGYAAATVDEIAERAEFGKGTLYNYFEDGKRAILFAILDELYGDLCHMAEAYFAAEVDAPRPARATFRDFLARMMAYFLDKQDAFFILSREAQRMALAAEPGTAAFLTHQRERVAEQIARPLADAMARGALRPLDAHAVAHMLLGNVHGYLMFTCCAAPPAPVKPGGHRPPAPSGPGFADEAADFLTAMLFDGLLPTRP